MLRSSLFWKFFGASLALIVLTMLVAGWMAAHQLETDVELDIRDRLRKQVELLVELLSPNLEARDPAALQERVQDLGERTAIRITLIRPDGVVLADSHKDPEGMDNHLGRPEVQASLQGPFGESKRTSGTLSTPMIYVARAVPGNSGPRGFVRGALALDSVASRTQTLRRIVLGASAVAVVFGLLAALLLARRLARPLRTLSAAASAIARGNYHSRVPTPSGDELGDLGRSFNEMAQRLEHEVSTIRRDQRELRAILGGMVEGVLAIDTEERVVLMNDAAGAILGVQEPDASGRKIWESVRIPQIVSALTEAVQTQTMQSAVVHLPSAGKDRVVHVTASPLVGDSGAQRGAVLVLDDVTDREQIESVRRDFVANASHELKTPIASVRGLVETILGDRDMDVDTRNGFLERVLKQAQRLGDLVAEMLVLSRLETPGSRVATQALDLRETVREVLDDAAPLAAERRIKIVSRLPEEALRVMGERESLRRIAGNLLDNAIKYTEPGGEVRVAVTRLPDGAILEVSDTGPGIPREKHDRVFERFFRVDEGRSRDMGGTGLGLAIVKHLVQALRARVELESEVGQGSTFRVIFRVP